MRLQGKDGKFIPIGALRTFICPRCSIEFSAYTERKYCGHSCASKTFHETRRNRNEPHPSTGKHPPNYKGGRRVMKSGYIQVWITGKGYCYEHRVIIEQKLGRPLERKEVVHHLDGNRANNNPDNLALLTKVGHDRFETTRRYQEGWKRNLTAFGETKRLSEWAKDSRCRVTSRTLGQRLRRGMDPETAINTPNMRPRTY